MTWIKRLFTRKPDTHPMPEPEESFTEWYVRQGIRNFSAGEIKRYFNRKSYGIPNTYPPRDLWPNILPALRVLDELRDALNCPIRITSSYRSPSYNHACGGKPSSFHKQFKAIDFQVDGSTLHEAHKILEKWRKKGKFAGGLSLYPTFIHVDTRGWNATW